MPDQELANLIPHKGSRQLIQIALGRWSRDEEAFDAVLARVKVRFRFRFRARFRFSARFRARARARARHSLFFDAF